MGSLISSKNTSSVALEITNIWKRYWVTGKERPYTLKNALFSRLGYFRHRTAYWALQDVNLRIMRGQSVGLIGNNGAGKSTLFRLISGLSRPTRGTIVRNGRMGSLLELGAGFNLEFTGRENVITGSILAGLTRKEAEARLPEVIAFAELEDFIDEPLRTYSNGMFVRLAFATEISLNPDILLIDEVLAVGDIAFQRKCLAYLDTLKADGKTIVVVSHSMEQILKTCEQVIWLEHGTVRTMGAAAEVVRSYQQQLLTQPTTSPRRAKRTGTEVVTIEHVSVFTSAGEPTEAILSGDGMLVRITLTAHVPIDNPILQVAVLTDTGLKCCEVNTKDDDVEYGRINGTVSFSLSFASLPLAANSYALNVGVYASDWSVVYNYRSHAGAFAVQGVPATNGFIYAHHIWSSQPVEAPIQMGR